MKTDVTRFLYSSSEYKAIILFRMSKKIFWCHENGTSTQSYFITFFQRVIKSFVNVRDLKVTN